MLIIIFSSNIIIKISLLWYPKITCYCKHGHQLNLHDTHLLLSIFFHQIIISHNMLEDINRRGEQRMQAFQGRFGRKLLASLSQSRQDSCCHFTTGLHKVCSNFLKRIISACQSQWKHCVKFFHDVRTELGRNKCGTELFALWQHHVIYVQGSQILKYWLWH